MTRMLGGQTLGFKLPKHMPAKYLDQVAVQNTWYTVIDEQNVEIDQVCVRIATADETLEVEWTIDGEVYTSSANRTADTYWWLHFVLYNTDAITIGNTPNFQGSLCNAMFNTELKARAFKMRIRKTTANGANHLYVGVAWSQW